MVKVDVDTRDLERTLKEIPPAVQRSTQQEIKDQLLAVQQQARSRHRYTTRTGRLNQSVQTQLDQSGMSGEAYLESDIADYGIYIVEGHGSWEADNFLDEAVFAKQMEIESNITRAIESAVGGAAQ